MKRRISKSRPRPRSQSRIRHRSSRSILLWALPVIFLFVLGIGGFVFFKGIAPYGSFRESSPSAQIKTRGKNDPAKSVEYFILQNTSIGTGTTTQNYDVFVAEMDATNSKNVTLRNAYVEVSGVGVASSAYTMEAKVNNQASVVYDLPSTGGNPSPFTVHYNVTSLNYDYVGSTTPSNTLTISFPTAPTSVSLLGAKQVLTFDSD